MYSRNLSPFLLPLNDLKKQLPFLSTLHSCSNNFSHPLPLWTVNYAGVCLASRILKVRLAYWAVYLPSLQRHKILLRYCSIPTYILGHIQCQTQKRCDIDCCVCAQNNPIISHHVYKGKDVTANFPHGFILQVAGVINKRTAHWTISQDSSQISRLLWFRPASPQGRFPSELLLRREL